MNIYCCSRRGGWLCEIALRYTCIIEGLPHHTLILMIFWDEKLCSVCAAAAAVHITLRAVGWPLKLHRRSL